MLVDFHTHFFLEKHFIGDKFFRELEYTGGSRMGFLTDADRYAREVLAYADKAVVFGLNAKASGVVVPNEEIAGLVRQHPDQLIGFASVDPNAADAPQELEYCIRSLKLKGLKLGPIYQHFHPQDEKLAYPLYETAQQLGIPIMWHIGTSFVREGLLEYTRPYLLERIAVDFPDLNMIIAHMGHPWEAETIALIRKQPHVYADVSALYYRPWQFYNMLVLAMEYKVTHKMLFGTDYPVTTIESSIRGIRSIRRFWEGTYLPAVPDEVMDGIIYGDFLDKLNLA